MYKLIIFAIVMLALAGICNGQSSISFGAINSNDTSRTGGQLKLVAYAGSGDTVILVVLPNGIVKKVSKTAFNTIYTAGYGLQLNSNVFSVDTTTIATLYALNNKDSFEHITAKSLVLGGDSVETKLSLSGNGHTYNFKTETDGLQIYGDGFRLFRMEPDGHLIVETLLASSVLTASEISGTDVFVRAITTDSLKLAGKNVDSAINTKIAYADTLIKIATKYDISQIPLLDSNKFVKYADTAAMLAPYLRTSSLSNGSIQYSSNKTSLASTQSAIDRLVNLRAGTDIGSPEVWLIMDSIGTVRTGSVIDSVRDLSGHGHNFYSTASGLKPTFTAGGCNGNTYALFSRTNNSVCTTASTVNLDTNCSFYIVFRVVNTSIPTPFILAGNMTTVDGSNVIAFFNNGGPTDSALIDAHNYLVFEMDRLGSQANYTGNGAALGRMSHWTNYTFAFNRIGSTTIGTTPDMEVYEIIGYTTRNTAYQKQNIRNYLYRKYGISYASFGSFGDSWIFGSNVTLLNRLSTKISAYLGYGEVNLGIPGTVLENTGGATNNGYSRMGYLPKPRGPFDIFMIMYGGNDANNAATTTYSPITFKYQLATVVNNLLSKGWQRSQLILSNQAIFNNAIGGSSRWDSFANNILSVASEMNLMSADVRTFYGTKIATNGSLGGDGVHPTAIQADTIARYIVNILQNGWTQGTGTATSASAFNPVPNALPYTFTGTTSTWVLPPVTGNVGTYIRVSNAGTGAITTNSFAGGNDIFTTSATNTYAINAGDAIIFYNTGIYWKVQ